MTDARGFNIGQFCRPIMCVPSHMVFLNREGQDIHKCVPKPSTGLCGKGDDAIPQHAVAYRCWAVYETGNSEPPLDRKISSRRQDMDLGSFECATQLFVVPCIQELSVAVDVEPQPAVERDERKPAVVQDDHRVAARGVVLFV